MIKDFDLLLQVVLKEWGDTLPRSAELLLKDIIIHQYKKALKLKQK